MSMPPHELTLDRIKARRPSFDGQVSVDEADWLIETLTDLRQRCGSEHLRKLKNPYVLQIHVDWYHTDPQHRKDIVAFTVERVLGWLAHDVATGQQ